MGLPTPASWRFAAWWLGMLLLHSLCIVYFAGFSQLYRKLLPKSNLAFQFRTYSIGIAETEYHKVAVAHDVVSAVHWYYLALMIVGSFQRRRLVFYPDLRVSAFARTHIRRCLGLFRTQRVTPETEPDRHSSSLDALSKRVVDSISRAGDRLFSRTGIMGVDFVYFDHLLFVRELVETSLQTYQAYRMTQLLPRLWLIRIYVALLVANCWIVPILHRVYYDRHRLRRMMSLVCDVVLDIVSSMGISFFLFVSYAPQYTDHRFGFPFNNWYDEIWFTSVYQEFQMMVIVSWVDLASRLVFAFGVVQCMESIKDMLIQDLQPRRKSFAKPAVAGAGLAPFIARARLLTQTLTRGPSRGLTKNASRNPHGRLTRGIHFILHVIGPGVFIIWGFAILGTHIYAESQHSSWPCLLPLRPWLNRQPACSLVEINCDSLGTTRDDGGVTSDAWFRFDPRLAAGIRIRHCTNFTMPKAIGNFVHTITIKIYNTTVTSWPEEAGLTQGFHSRMRALYMVRTDFYDKTLPPGLTNKQFPQTFRSFIVSVTNLESLPQNLDMVWPTRMSISIEFANFTAIPDVVIRLKPGLISFSRNPINTLPQALFEIPTLGNLLLSYTAIQSLPQNVTNLGKRLYLLFIEGTNVSSFWSWMDPFILRSLSYHKGFFNAHGTPYCVERAQILNGSIATFAAFSPNLGQASIMDVSTAEKLAFARAAVVCTSDFKTLYPLEIEDARSALSTT